MKVKIIITAFLVVLLSALPVIANDPPHNEASGVTCGECHGQVLFCTDPDSMDPENLRLKYDDVCLRCHKFTESPYHACNGPLVSSHQTVRCIDCHHPHYQTPQFWYGRKYFPSAYEIATGEGRVTDTETIPVVGLLTEITYSGLSLKPDRTVDDLEAKTSDGRGMLFLPNRNSPYNSRMIYSITDSGEGSGTIKVKGEVSSVSTDGFVVAYGQAVKRDIPYISASSEPVVMMDQGGRYGLAHNDSQGPGGTDSTPSGICQVCHTATNHWRNDGTMTEDHFSGQNCTKNCHKHTNGFLHGGGGGGKICIECHNSGSHVIHLDADDPRGPAVLCDECHDFDNMPKFKKQDGTGNHLLSETDICNTCHSNSGTYDGVNDLDLGVKYGNNGEQKYNWVNGIYEEDKVTLKLGREKWCATCHDEEPAIIKGVSAPNVIGDEDGDYIYGTGWGYYKTGHGLDSGTSYPSSGGVVQGADKECGNCHDYSLAHIDGESRTYDDGDVQGLDPAIYRQGYRLKLVGGGEPMIMPRPSNIGNSADQFRVCFQSGCHGFGPQFTDTTNMDTNMVTLDQQTNSVSINRHAYHLNFNNQQIFSGDWSGERNSRMTCVSCHNVHGSTQLAMVRDGKLIGHEPGQRIWYKNDAVTYIKAISSDPPIPEDLPLSASDGKAWIGASSLNLCAHCHPSNGFTGSNDRAPFQDVNQAPVLEWTGTNDLENDGVVPNSGAGNSIFTFRVSYSDINNDTPSPIEVWVDLNDKDGYEPDEKFTVIETDTLDFNLVDGKTYAKSISIAKAGDNTLNYRFYAYDGRFEAAGAPTADKTLTILNNSPTLSWTGENFYQADGVNPDIGSDGANFTFRVQYSDTDGDCPDTDGVNVVVNSTTYNLTQNDSGSCTTGRIYYESIPLNTTVDVDLDYHFAAKDTAGTSATGDSTSDHVVTVLADDNSPPFLEWVDGACRTEGVKPAYGAVGADFEFYVKYTDPDGDCPESGGFVRVTIDGSTYNMTAVEVDENCSDGKLYSVTIALDTASDPFYFYSFSAQDDEGSEAYGDPALTSTYKVEVVDAVKVRPAGGDGWYSSIQSAIDAVDNEHAVLVYDGTYNEDIYFDRFNDNNTIVRSVCGPDTTMINGTGGSSTVRFYRNNGDELDGFQVTGGTIGIFLEGAQASINNCLIHNNTQSGIYAAQSGDMPKLTLTNSEIYNNSSDRGGGVHIWRGTGHIISNTIIRNNSITGDSMADGGGGVHLFQIAEIAISNSVIRDNMSDYPGGGLYVTQVPDTTGAGLTVEDTIISGNATHSGGGGVYSDLSKIKFVRSSITGNTADGNGGALSRPSAGNSAYFESCIFADNQGALGGMAKLNGGTLDIVNSTIANNRATNLGGAIYNQLATINIRNSILWGNQAANLGHIASFNGGSMTITDSIIQSGGYGNFINAPFFNGNVIPVVSGFASEDDPWFVGGGDYHIQAFSPAVDNASAAYAPELDIDGQGRPQGVADDIGADEHYP